MSAATSSTRLAAQPGRIFSKLEVTYYPARGFMTQARGRRVHRQGPGQQSGVCHRSQLGWQDQRRGDQARAVPDSPRPQAHSLRTRRVLTHTLGGRCALWNHGCHRVRTQQLDLSPSGWCLWGPGHSFNISLWPRTRPRGSSTPRARARARAYSRSRLAFFDHLVGPSSWII